MHVERGGCELLLLLLLLRFGESTLAILIRRDRERKPRQARVLLSRSSSSGRRRSRSDVLLLLLEQSRIRRLAVDGFRGFQTHARARDTDVDGLGALTTGFVAGVGQGGRDGSELASEPSKRTSTPEATPTHRSSLPTFNSSALLNTTSLPLIKSATKSAGNLSSKVMAVSILGLIMQRASERPSF